jgi:hypothetical protein
MAEARDAWDEVGDALRSFGDAARRLGDAVSGVVRDPEFQEKGQRLATTLGAAITATVDQVGKELSDAFARRKGAPPNSGPEND